MTGFNQVIGRAGRREEGGAILGDEGGGRELRRRGNGVGGTARKGWEKSRARQRKGEVKARAWPEGWVWVRLEEAGHRAGGCSGNGQER